MRQAEKELELRLIYCIGPAEGQLSDQSRIGISSRRGFDAMVQDFQSYRSEPLTVHFRHIVRGNALALRLQTRMTSSLTADGKAIRASWWRIAGEAAALLIAECANAEGIELLTEDDAKAIESDRYHQLMQNFSGRGYR